jgi:hypothetical protein
MAKTEANSQIKRDRRTVLATLRMIYPRWMDGEELYLIVLNCNPEYDRRLLVKDLSYLNEKDYVAWKGADNLDAKTISVKACIFRLTAAGTDIANGLVDDPTLEV